MAMHGEYRIKVTVLNGDHMVSQSIAYNSFAAETEWKLTLREVQDVAERMENCIDEAVERILDQRQEDPREKGDDDGVEYGDPRDHRDGKE